MNTFIRSDDRPDGHKGRPCKGIINAHPTYKQRTCRPCKGIINAHPTYRQRTCRPCKEIINAHPTYKQRTCRPCKGIINAHPTYKQRTCRPCKEIIKWFYCAKGICGFLSSSAVANPTTQPTTYTEFILHLLQTYHFGLPNGPFHSPKRTVWRSNMHRFATHFGPSCNWLNTNRL